MPKFYVILPEKIFSGFFFLGGGSKMPVSYTYARSVDMQNGHFADWTTGGQAGRRRRSLLLSLCSGAPC